MGKCSFLDVNLGMGHFKSIVSEKRCTVLRVFNTHLWGFSGDRWENVHLESNPRHVTPQIDLSQKNKHCSEGFNTHLWGF